MNITEFQHKFYDTTQQPWCEEKMLCAKFKAWLFDYFSFFGKWQYIYWFGTDML